MTNYKLAAIALIGALAVPFAPDAYAQARAKGKSAQSTQRATQNNAKPAAQTSPSHLIGLIQQYSALPKSAQVYTCDLPAKDRTVFAPHEPLLHYNGDSGGELDYHSVAYYDNAKNRTVAISMTGDLVDIAVWKGRILRQYPYDCNSGTIDFQGLAYPREADYQSGFGQRMPRLAEIRNDLTSRLTALNSRERLNLDLEKSYSKIPRLEGATNPGMDFTNGSLDVYYDGVTRTVYNNSNRPSRELNADITAGYRSLINEAASMMRRHAPAQRAAKIAAADRLHAQERAKAKAVRERARK